VRVLPLQRRHKRPEESGRENAMNTRERRDMFAAAALRGAIAADPDDTIPVDQLATYSWDVAEAMLTEYDARMRKKEERFVAAMRAPERVPMPRRLGRPTPDKAGVSAQGAE
jgi:hypothetical protein